MWWCLKVPNPDKVCEVCKGPTTQEKSYWYCDDCYIKWQRECATYNVGTVEYLYAGGKKQISMARNKEIWKRYAGYIPKRFQ